MFCVECGNEITEGGRFCSVCGAPVAGTESQQEPTQRSMPPLPPVLGSQGPGAGPPKRRKALLIPGIAAAVIIVAAALALGLYFGLKGQGNPVAAETSVTVAASTTTSAATTTTTQAPATTTTAAPVTTEASATTAAPITIQEPTTTEAPTTTVVNQAAVLAVRAAEWMKLLEAIPASAEDLTPKIASYITPADQAQKRAANYVKTWKEPGDPADIIANDPFQAVTSVTFWPEDANSATVVCSFKLQCRDGITNRGYESLDWKLVDGEWKRALGFPAQQPPEKRSVVRIGQTMAVGGVLWAPETAHELKHLSAKGGPTAAGRFLTVEFYIENQGKAAVAPASFELFAVDSSGKAYAVSATADKWWDEDAQLRRTKVAPGDSTYLWYTFDIPKGADLGSFRFRVQLPGV